MAGKVQIATFYEQVSKKTGDTYYKAAFGPFDLLLFKDKANPIIGKDGTSYSWNLVLGENYFARKTGRTFPDFGHEAAEHTQAAAEEPSSSS